jgi:hypothetical protein
MEKLTKENEIRNSKAYQQVFAKIDKHVHSQCYFPDGARWYCGITNNPTKRKQAHRKQHPQMMFFKSFYAYTLDVAHQIEKDLAEYCINYPQKGNAKQNSHYVYIFKAHPTLIDKILN